MEQITQEYFKVLYFIGENTIGIESGGKYTSIYHSLRSFVRPLDYNRYLSGLDILTKMENEGLLEFVTSQNLGLTCVYATDKGLKLFEENLPKMSKAEITFLRKRYQNEISAAVKLKKREPVLIVSGPEADSDDGPI